MTISDKIGNTHVEAMNKILSFITSFDVHRLLYAISAKRLDEDDIKSLTLDICDQNLKLERQREYLFKFGKTFNQEYTTDDNKCFDTSARLFFKMRSGVKGIKKQVKSFCLRSRQKLRPDQEAPQAIDRSLISVDALYMKDLFGIESYPDCVRELFDVMIRFHQNMMDCLDESIRVLSEEKETKQDFRRCIELLKQACEKSRKDQIVFVDAMNNSPALRAAFLMADEFKPNDKNPVLKEWRNSQNNKGLFASSRFHNCTHEDISKISFYQTMTEADGDPDLVTCMTIFNCTREKAEAINVAISRFDNMLPPICKRNKIPSIYLHVFMRWCSEGVGYETFLNYFNKRYKEAGGGNNVIGKSALSAASRECAKSSKKYETIKKDLLSELDKIYPQKP